MAYQVERSLLKAVIEMYFQQLNWQIFPRVGREILWRICSFAEQLYVKGIPLEMPRANRKNTGQFVLCVRVHIFG